MLLQMALFHSFQWLSNILLYICLYIYTRIYRSATDHRVTQIPIQSGTGSHTHILPHILFHYGLSQDTEYSSLSYTIEPCCLSTQSDFHSYCYRSRTILFLMKGLQEPYSFLTFSQIFLAIIVNQQERIDSRIKKKLSGVEPNTLGLIQSEVSIFTHYLFYTQKRSNSNIKRQLFSKSHNSTVCYLQLYYSSFTKLVQLFQIFCLSRRTKFKSQESFINIFGQYGIRKGKPEGNFLAVQWLGLQASTAGGTGLIPGGGTEIPHATWHDQ